MSSKNNFHLVNSPPISNPKTACEKNNHRFYYVFVNERWSLSHKSAYELNNLPHIPAKSSSSQLYYRTVLVSLFAYKMFSTQRLLYHSKQKFAKIGIETLGVTRLGFPHCSQFNRALLSQGHPPFRMQLDPLLLIGGLTVVFAHLRRGANCR